MILPGLGSIFKIISFLLASWILVHVLGVLGVILVIAYPIWWLFLPQKTVCFFCRIRAEGEWCPFCRRKINKKNGIYPETLKSALLNGGLILVFSILSLFFIFGESLLLKRLGFPATPKTVFFVIPAKGQFYVGDVFPMKIDIVGIKTPINAVQADISFDATKVEVVDFSNAESFANIFLQKEINNELGYARLSGGLPNPGFGEEHGFFGTVYFKGKAPGAVKVEFLPSSLVLANDGRGTNVLKEIAPATYLILPKEEKIDNTNIEGSTPTNDYDVYTEPLVKGEKAGEAARDAQVKMTFYEENEVLGAEMASSSGKAMPAKFNFFTFLGEALGKFDRLVISVWRRVFGIK